MSIEFGEVNKYDQTSQFPVVDLVFTGPKKSLVDRVSGNAAQFTRNTIGTYVGADGLIKTAAAGELRYTYDPLTGEELGLLVETTATNFLYPSTPDYTSGFGSWSNGLAPTVPNAGIAPDGTNTAVRVDWSTVSGAERLYYNTGTPTTVGITEVHSFFLKPVGTGVVFGVTFQGVNWSWLNGGTSTRGFYFDFDSETFYANTQTGYGEVITKFPNGWYRISIPAINNGTGFFDTYVQMRRNIQVGDWYIWGVQRENGSFPTSYIPTSGSTIGRDPDTITLTNNNIYNKEKFDIINDPFGMSAGSNTLTLLPSASNSSAIKRATIFSPNIAQSKINTFAEKTDEFWRWRVTGTSFGLPQFLTDGQVTVDWGDGTVETLTTSDHTYTDGKTYHEIGFRLDSGTYFRPYINNNATHRTKVVALGPAPESMKLNSIRAFNECVNLEAFDATVDATGGIDFTLGWFNCSSLTSFPLIDTSNGEIFSSAWSYCSSLTNFPEINTSSGTNFLSAWDHCTNLQFFPEINTSNGRDFRYAWSFCSSLTSFPTLDISNGETFQFAWYRCVGLTDFPANFFDTWTGTPANNCFVTTWADCFSLTATSVENILNSIDTSLQSAPASGVDITITYNASSGTPNISTAVSNLKDRNWTITLNGVAQ